MKEILNFIRWQWNKWEFWQKCYIVGAFFFGLGIGMPNPYRTFVMAVPVSMFFIATFKWFIWDMVKSSWNSYKKEKETLFDTIREGRQQ